MRLTTDLRRELFANASDLPLVLAVLNHSTFTSPIRVVNDQVNLVSNGDTYVAFPFKVTLPDSAEDSPPRARLEISNVSREIIQVIRLATGAISVSLSVVRRDAPDVVEASFPGMLLRNVRARALEVTGDLEFEDLVREPFPAHVFAPAHYPGIVP